MDLEQLEQLQVVMVHERMRRRCFMEKLRHGRWMPAGGLFPDSESDLEAKKGMVWEEANSGDEFQWGWHDLDSEKGSVHQVITDSCELVVAMACLILQSSVEMEENACQVGVSWKVHSTSENWCHTSSSWQSKSGHCWKNYFASLLESTSQLPTLGIVFEWHLWPKNNRNSAHMQQTQGNLTHSPKKRLKTL